MKWLSIDYIKQHSRIDYDCEDALLELYGNAAEQAVMNLLQRDYEDIVATFGIVTGDTRTDMPVPAAIVNATLLVCDHLYNHRAPDETVQLHSVRSLEFLLKPYMRLCGTFGDDQRNGYIIRLAQQRQLLDYKCVGVDIHQDTALADLYGRIATYTNWWLQFNDPGNLILADMKTQTEQLESDVATYLETLNE